MSAALHVIAGVGPGRLATIAHPRVDPWPAGKLAELARCGVDVLVSALTVAEQQRLGFGSTEATATQFGVDFISFPTDEGEIGRGEATNAIALAGRLAAHVRAGRFVATQSFAGIGRSTLLACTTLVLLGIEPGEALHRVTADPATPLTRDWIHDLTGSAPVPADAPTGHRPHRSPAPTPA